MFYEAAYRVTSSNKAIRIYYLKKGMEIPSTIEEDSKLQTELSASIVAQANKRLRCKLCRKELATGDDLLEHSKVTNDSGGSIIGKACSGYFIEPVCGFSYWRSTK